MNPKIVWHTPGCQPQYQHCSSDLHADATEEALLLFIITHKTLSYVALLKYFFMFSGLWIPQFKTEDGNDAKVKYFNYVYGVPDCATTQQRAIFDLDISEDKYVPFIL